MTLGTLLLSPHSADIAMSAFGILSKKLLPEPVTLLTVFSLSNYFMHHQRPRPDLPVLLNLLPRPGDLVRSLKRNVGRFGTNNPLSIAYKLLDLEQPYKVSRVRLMEDIRFSRRMGIKFRYLNIPDSKMRSGKPIMDPDWSLANEQGTMDRTHGIIYDLISRVKAQAIVAPWPNGSRQHVDHRMVSEIATRIAEETGVRLFHVDDQPYSRRPFETMTDRRGHEYIPLVVRLSVQEMKLKVKAMGLYWSQMVPEYWQAVLQRVPGSEEKYYSETLWQPSPEGGSLHNRDGAR